MSKLADGNRAMREKNYQAAISFYIEALKMTPGLAKIISSNLALARQKQENTVPEIKPRSSCSSANLR